MEMSPLAGPLTSGTVIVLLLLLLSLLDGLLGFARYHDSPFSSDVHDEAGRTGGGGGDVGYETGGGRS